jgi:hypothetical protein
MPVEWHEECQRNAVKSHQRLVDELERMAKRVAESHAALIHRDAQIMRAKRLKKKSFDADRFGANVK